MCIKHAAPCPAHNEHLRMAATDLGVVSRKGRSPWVSESRGSWLTRGGLPVLVPLRCRISVQDLTILNCTTANTQTKDFCWFKELQDGRGRREGGRERFPSALCGNHADSSIEGSPGRETGKGGDGESSSSSQRPWKFGSLTQPHKEARVKSAEWPGSRGSEGLHRQDFRDNRDTSQHLGNIHSQPATICSAWEVRTLKCAHWACTHINMAFCSKPPKSGLHCLGEKRRKWTLEHCRAWRNREKAWDSALVSRKFLEFPCCHLFTLHPTFSAHSLLTISQILPISAKNLPPSPHPKVYLLRTLAALIVPSTNSLAISLVLDFAGSVLSPSPVSEFLGSRAWVSYLCVSQQDTAARRAPPSPSPPTLPNTHWSFQPDQTSPCFP